MAKEGFQSQRENQGNNEILHYPIQEMKKRDPLGKSQKPRNYVPDSDSPEVWHRGSLSILTKIKQAGTSFLMMSQKLRFRNLKQRDFQLIGDSASQYDSLYYENQFNDRPNILLQSLYLVSNFFNKLQCGKKTGKLTQIRKSYIIKPDSKLIDCWNLLIMIFLLINFFYQSFQIVFSQQFEQDHYQIQWLYYDLSMILYFLDIVRKSQTSFYHNGQLVSDQTMIITRYIKTQLLLDILTITSLGAEYLPQIYYDYIKITSLLKYFQINRILKQLKDHSNLDYFGEAMFTLFQLLLKIILTAHICGISFIYITKFEQNSQTWMHQSNLVDSSWKQKYVTSIYWAIVTMITLGYGDIIPVTTEERIFVIFISFFACGIFAYTFNSIGTIFSNMNQQANKMRQQIANLTMYLSKRRVSRSTQMKISKYVQYIYEKQLESEMKCEQTLDQLTIELKSELAIQMYGQMLSDAKPFKLNFGKAVLNNLALHMKQCHFPGDTIILQSGSLNKQFYFIIDGQLEQIFSIKNETKSVKLKVLTSGNYFGKDSFFSGMAENFSIKTKGIVNLAYLEFDDFLATLQKFPAEFQKYFEQKDQFIFNGNEGFQLICSICNGFRHTPDICPLLSFKRSQDKINYSIVHQDLDLTQDRKQEFIRKRKKWVQKPFYIEELHMDALDILHDLNYYPDQSLLDQKHDLIEMSLERAPDQETHLKIDIEDLPLLHQQKIQEEEQKKSATRTSQIFYDVIAAQKLMIRNTQEQEIKQSILKTNSLRSEEEPQVRSMPMVSDSNYPERSKSLSSESSGSSHSSSQSSSSQQSISGSSSLSPQQSINQEEQISNQKLKEQKQKQKQTVQLKKNELSQQKDKKQTSIQYQNGIAHEFIELLKKNRNRLPQHEAFFKQTKIKSSNIDVKSTHTQDKIDGNHQKPIRLIELLKIVGDQNTNLQSENKLNQPLETLKPNELGEPQDITKSTNLHRYRLGDQFQIQSSFNDSEQIGEFEHYFKQNNVSLILNDQTENHVRDKQLNQQRDANQIVKVPDKQLLLQVFSPIN